MKTISNVLLKSIFLLVYGYKKISNKEITSNDCDAYAYGTFSTLDEAKQACKDNDTCSGIYDINCGADGTFHLCPKTDDVLKDATASCVHEKIIIGKEGPQTN